MSYPGMTYKRQIDGEFKGDMVPNTIEAEYIENPTMFDATNLMSNFRLNPSSFEIKVSPAKLQKIIKSGM